MFDLYKRSNDEAFLKQLATERKNKDNYKGFEGNLTAFLQPMVLPGYSVYIMHRKGKLNGNDKDFITGTYIAERTDIKFGLHGARRTVEIGPKIG